MRLLSKDNAEAIANLFSVQAGKFFPNQRFHQHFNTGAEPAKYMAFQGGRALKYYGIVVEVDTHGGVDKSVKLGGNRIEYEDEDPEIRRQFKEEIAKNGAPACLNSSPESE